MDLETVHSQIQKHLGKPVNELFASFDDKPLGSASIGQVHKAELFDGTIVAVKVRRPGVVDTVARDFALLENVLDTFAKDGIGGMDIKGFIMELGKTSKIELDFTNEATNLERFWDNNNERPGIESPKCYREYTNEAILTEDFVTGHEVGDADYLETLDDDERDRIAALVADNFATQVLVDGFYHADPHSGNVLFKEPISGETAGELFKFLDNTSKSTAKTAETLDMLEKGNVRMRTDIGIEQKSLDSVRQMVRYVIRALMIIALFLGSCLLCTVPPNAMEGTQLPAVFPIMGFVGYIVSLWLAYFLYRSVKKGK